MVECPKMMIEKKIPPKHITFPSTRPLAASVSRKGGRRILYYPPHPSHSILQNIFPCKCINNFYVYTIKKFPKPILLQFASENRFCSTKRTMRKLTVFFCSELYSLVKLTLAFDVLWEKRVCSLRICVFSHTYILQLCQKNHTYH